MKLFIAYKFSNVKDKDRLKKELFMISEILESFGHTTFILGRDTKSWLNKKHPAKSKLRKMTSQIIASDGVFVYLNNNALSLGLLYEIHLAWILQKKILIAAGEGVKTGYLKFLANKGVIRFGEVEELKEKLK